MKVPINDPANFLSPYSEFIARSAISGMDMIQEHGGSEMRLRLYAPYEQPEERQPPVPGEKGWKTSGGVDIEILAFDELTGDVWVRFPNRSKTYIYPSHKWQGTWSYNPPKPPGPEIPERIFMVFRQSRHTGEFRYQMSKMKPGAFLGSVYMRRPDEWHVICISPSGAFAPYRVLGTDIRQMLEQDEENEDDDD